MSRVQAARRLVGQHDRRTVYQRTGHRHALLLAARQLIGFVLRPLGQAQQAQHLARRLRGLPTRTTGDERRNQHVLQRRKLRQQLVELEDKADVPVAEGSQLALVQPLHLRAVYRDRPRVRPVQRPHDLQERGLARPAGAHDAEHLAALHVQADAPQHLQGAETFGYIS